MPDPGVAAAPASDLPHPLGEQRPVRQAGERVVQGPVVELGLQALAVADVLDVHDQVRRAAPGSPGTRDVLTDTQMTRSSGSTNRHSWRTICAPSPG